MKPTWQETRKARKIARIMEEFQIGYEEAEEKYRESFRLIGSRGGKSPNAARPFRDVPGLASRAGKVHRPSEK